MIRDNGKNLIKQLSILKEIKVGIIGFGSIGNKHLKYLNNIKNINVNIYYLNFRKRKINSKYKTLFKDVINDVSKVKKNFFDLIFICTPSSCHHSDFLLLEKYSKNFFIEKPLCINQRDLNIFKKSKKIYIGYVLNHKLILKDFIKYLKNFEEKIIKIEINCSSYLPNWRTQKNFEKSHTAQDLLSGGILYELSHEFEYAYNLFGKFKLYNYMFKKTLIIGNIVDRANISARLIKDNIPINFIFSLSSKRSYRFCKVYTANTILVLDLLKNKIFKFYKKKKSIISSKENDDMYFNQMNYVLMKLFKKGNIFNNKNIKSSNFVVKFLSEIQ